MVKKLFHGFAMCQSMFCAIPFPCHVWDEDARDKMLLFLPVIGLEIGLVWAALGWLCGKLGLPAPVSALLLCACPYLATGFIHLDGFMDVTDAVKSYRSLERRREILKDSHVGSFSVISCILLMLAQFAFFLSLETGANYGILILIPVVSRCGSALAVTLLKPMSTSQYVQVKKSWSKAAVVAVMAAAALFAGFWFFGKTGFVLLGVMAGYLLALRRAVRSLEGMNGDISGYALTWSELAGAAVLALL